MHEADLRRLELTQLVVLDALLDTMSVTEAARLIRLSQPATSRALARLRAAFGDNLLVRAGARLQRTPRAEALREPLKQLLRDAAALYSPPLFEPAISERSFRGAVPDVVAAVILPDLLARLRSEAPGCRLTIIPWPARGEWKSDVDFAIATEPGIFPGYRMRRLYEDRDVLAFRAGGAAPASGEMLSRGHVVVVAIGHSEDLADRWLRDAGFARSIAAVVPHYLQALHLVGRSDLLAILPSRLVAALGPALGVASAELPIEQEPDVQWLLHPPHLAGDPGLKWLCDILHDVTNRR